jgi:hypothetical protein
MDCEIDWTEIDCKSKGTVPRTTFLKKDWIRQFCNYMLNKPRKTEYVHLMYYIN